MLYVNKKFLLTEVKVKVLAVILADLCWKYIIKYVSNMLSNATVARD